MINFLTETKDVLKANGYTPDDIVFIGEEATGKSCTWTEFETLADRDYDNGFGGVEVKLSLVIVFRDGARLVRDEYDGAEGWDLISPFKMPMVQKRIKKLFY